MDDSGTINIIQLLVRIFIWICIQNRIQPRPKYSMASNNIWTMKAEQSETRSEINSLYAHKTWKNWVYMEVYTQVYTYGVKDS